MKIKDRTFESSYNSASFIGGNFYLANYASLIPQVSGIYLRKINVQSVCFNFGILYQILNYNRIYLKRKITVNEGNFRKSCILGYPSK